MDTGEWRRDPELRQDLQDEQDYNSKSEPDPVWLFPSISCL
jgi:hypothetical protein